ncbi:MAG: diguanylate cyclase [Alphaproteobacteria bacterium]|jgi:two-component system cell cycle response regulator|nr:diguanylate cyclase [Alphaproteobacteria bacterium]
MHASARVLLYSETDKVTEFSEKLEHHGFQPLAAKSREEALRIVAIRHPDIAIVDAGSGRDGVRFYDDLQEVRPDGGIPTIVIGHSEQPDDSERQAEFLPPPFRDVELFRRLEVLARLVTMQDELHRRSETSMLYGMTAPQDVGPPQEVPDAQVLVVADDEGRRNEVGGLVAPAAAVSTAAKTYEAMDRLLAGEFDAVVAVSVGDPEAILDFCRNLRNHVNLYNTPLLVLTDGGGEAGLHSTYNAGASDVLELPVEAEQLLPRLRHLMKQQRYRRAMQKTYREAQQDATADALTGLFSHGYLHAHLQKQIENCKQWQKSLSLGFFDITDMAGLNARHGYVAGDRLLRQIGGMIGGLVRAEDLAARLGGDKFCIVLPDAPMVAALPVLHRIAGVIDFTEFAVPGVDEPISIELRTGCAEWQSDDTAETLIARACANSQGAD